MAINKFQWSRFTFQPMLPILESNQYIKTYFSQKPQGQLKLKFHMETLYVEGSKFITNASDGSHAHIR